MGKKLINGEREREKERRRRRRRRKRYRLPQAGSLSARQVTVQRERARERREGGYIREIMSSS